ncbi:MAG TPA: hypothetical protein VJ508_09955 [Saprospiraceae bacterium]|nr:hypothetical protein [Saprospiraceae bacterium]
MISLLSIHWLLAVALWYIINGILHDIAVISKHASGYDRDLMRLLMDGHLLILSGVLMLVSWLMLRQGITWGYVIGGIVTLGMIVYCAMIFPFLKSIFTLVISIIVLLVCIAGIWR